MDHKSNTYSVAPNHIIITFNCVLFVKCPDLKFNWTCYMKLEMNYHCFWEEEVSSRRARNRYFRTDWKYDGFLVDPKSFFLLKNIRKHDFMTCLTGSSETFSTTVFCEMNSINNETWILIQLLLLNTCLNFQTSSMGCFISCKLLIFDETVNSFQW